MRPAVDDMVLENVSQVLDAIGRRDLGAVLMGHTGKQADAVRALTGLLREPGLPQVVFVLAVLGKRLARGDESWRKDFLWLAEHVVSGRPTATAAGGRQ